jgi:hypothetical protein
MLPFKPPRQRQQRDPALTATSRDRGPRATIASHPRTCCACCSRSCRLNDCFVPMRSCPLRLCNGSRAPDRAPGELMFDIDLVSPTPASRMTAGYKNRLRATLADGQLPGWTCQSARKPPQAPMGRLRVAVVGCTVSAPLRQADIWVPTRSDVAGPVGPIYLGRWQRPRFKCAEVFVQTGAD